MSIITTILFEGSTDLKRRNHWETNIIRLINPVKIIINSMTWQHDIDYLIALLRQENEVEVAILNCLDSVSLFLNSSSSRESWSEPTWGHFMFTDFHASVVFKEEEIQ